MATSHLKVEDVAERYRVRPETVRRWLAKGTLKGIRFSARGAWRIKVSELERYESEAAGVRP